MQLLILTLVGQRVITTGDTSKPCVQGTASEATLVALLGAKARVLQTMKAADPTLKDADIVPKLVAYSSELSHSSVERAGLLGGVLLRGLDTDGEHKLRGDTFRNAVEKDRADGLIPFFVVATLGTTSCCSFDRLDEIAEVANDVDIWVHVDAAYAGKSPEQRIRVFFADQPLPKPLYNCRSIPSIL